MNIFEEYSYGIILMVSMPLYGLTLRSITVILPYEWPEEDPH